MSVKALAQLAACPESEVQAAAHAVGGIDKLGGLLGKLLGGLAGGGLGGTVLQILLGLLVKKPVTPAPSDVAQLVASGVPEESAHRFLAAGLSAPSILAWLTAHGAQIVSIIQQVMDLLTPKGPVAA